MTPGPGEYYEEDRHLTRPSTCAAMALGGIGGRIAPETEDRFRNKDAERRALDPPPGHYFNTDKESTKYIKPSARADGKTAAFAEPVYEWNFRGKSIPSPSKVPGPGAYFTAGSVDPLSISGQQTRILASSPMKLSKLNGSREAAPAPRPGAAPNRRMLKRRPRTRSEVPGFGFTGDLVVHAQKPPVVRQSAESRQGADPHASRSRRVDSRSATFRSTIERTIPGVASHNQEFPSPGAYSLPSAFDESKSPVATAAFRDGSLRQGVVIKRDAQHMPEPGAYTPDILRVPHGSGADRHPGDPLGMAYRPSSSFSNLALDRFGEKLEHAAVPFASPPPGQYGEQGRPGTSVGSPLKSFNASYRAQTADAVDTFERSTVKTRRRPRTMSLNTRPTTGTLVSPSRTARPRFASLGAASCKSSSLAQAMVSPLRPASPSSLPLDESSSRILAPFGSKSFPSHQAFERNTNSDLLPTADGGGQRFQESRAASPSSASPPMAAQDPNYFSYTAFQEADVEFKRRGDTHASDADFSVFGEQVPQPKLDAPQPDRQSGGLNQDSFMESFVSFARSSSEVMPVFSPQVKVSGTSGMFTVRPGCRPATTVKPLLRSLTDAGEKPRTTFSAHGPRQAAAVKAGATKAPGPAFYPVPSQHQMATGKKSFNKNKTQRFC